MKQNGEEIGLRELVDGLLFSLQAEGRSARTVEYYRDRLRLFLDYAREKGWADSSDAIDSHRVREFLSWTGSRICEHHVSSGTRRLRKARPTTAWPYYRCLRRLFNWAVAEGYVASSPLATIHFRPPPEAPIEGYNIDELKRLLAVRDLDIKTGARFTGIRNKAMLLLFIDSGLRRGELVKIKLNDLDLRTFFEPDTDYRDFTIISTKPCRLDIKIGPCLHQDCVGLSFPFEPSVSACSIFTSSVTDLSADVSGSETVRISMAGSA